MQEYKTINMAGKLARYFLHNPLTPILAVFFILVGYFSLEFTPREEDPQMEVSGGTVIIAIPGATPKEIKNIVVQPLERRMKEIKGVENVYGIASENVGIINVQYFIGEDREKSNLKLYDKVMQNADKLPEGAMKPLVKPFDIDIDVPILSFAFYLKENSKLTEIELTKKVKEIQYKINSIENVAKTELKGDRTEQFNIEVDLNKLSGFHLSMGQIVEALKSLAVNSPNIDDTAKNGKMIVFGIKNAIETIDDVKNIIIAQYNNSPIYLKDIAKIEQGLDIQNFKSAEIITKNDKKLNKQVTLTISKLKGTNSVFIAEDVLEKLETIKPELEKLGIGIVTTRNYGERANEAVNELVYHLLISIVIIAILLAIALGFRESMIIIFTVPAILSITLFIAYLGDQTINRITLFAFLLSLGLLVDDSIVVIENIHRHLHNKESENDTMDNIVVRATDEIGSSTTIATIAIILTMLPMGFVGQMMGQFMKPIPLNVPVAMLASLYIAYIFTPFLAKRLLKKKI
jgi:multidrug efflux pump subunit AcrB